MRVSTPCSRGPSDHITLDQIRSRQIRSEEAVVVLPVLLPNAVERHRRRAQHLLALLRGEAKQGRDLIALGRVVDL